MNCFIFPFSGKDFPSTTGIYSITFKGSNKFYIGSASKTSCKYMSGNGFRVRWVGHLSFLQKGNYGCRKLQCAFKKYGIENMIFSILEECPSEQCLEREQFWIEYHNSYKCGYNTRETASSSSGVVQSNSSRMKKQATEAARRNKFKDQVLEEFSKCKSIRFVSDRLGLGRCVVSRILKDHNVFVDSKLTTGRTRMPL